MKVAVSVPDPVFEAAERLAEQLDVPRSRLYAQALAEYIASRGDAAITERLNAVYAIESSRVEPALVKAQSRTLSDEAW